MSCAALSQLMYKIEGLSEKFKRTPGSFGEKFKHTSGLFGNNSNVHQDCLEKVQTYIR